MSADVFRGVMPALMTPCTSDRQPNFDALVRKGRELVSAGMSAVVYCGSMGDWPLLSDEQRMEGVDRLVKAGLPVVVGTGAQSPKRAATLAVHAKKVGAKGLMLIPRVLSRGSSVAAQQAHFEGILESGVDLPCRRTSWGQLSRSADYSATDAVTPFSDVRRCAGLRQAYAKRL